MSSVPLKMLSSMAARELLAELAAQYTKSGAAVVTAEAAGGVDIARRVTDGEAVDVVVLADTAIDKLVAAGKLLAGSRVDLARSGVAIAVRDAAPRPAVGNEAAVKAAVLAAKTLSYSTGPSGIYLEKLFARWGILEEIRARTVVPPPGIPVGAIVAQGKAELGFQQLSELMNLAGIHVLGPLPPEIQTITVFSGGVASVSTRPQEARAFLQFMAAPAAAAAKQRGGMDGA